MTEEEALRALKGDDPLLAATAEDFLWRIWCQCGDPEADMILRAGVRAMQSGKLDEAEALFTRVIELVPDFAEGWNKRATVRYLEQNFTGSIADCEETVDRKSTRLNASHIQKSRMPSSA